MQSGLIPTSAGFRPLGGLSPECGIFNVALLLSRPNKVGVCSAGLVLAGFCLRKDATRGVASAGFHLGLDLEPRRWDVP